MICPVCQAQINKEQMLNYPQDSRQKANRLKMNGIYICPTCDIGFSWPRYSDDEISQIYTQGDYWEKRDVEIFKPHALPGHWALAQSRWSWLNKIMLPSPMRVLDIGAGHGFLGLVMGKENRLACYDVIEEDPYCAASWQATMKATLPHLPCQRFDHWTKVNGRYDLIVLSHVLEHLNHPQQVIQSLKGLLNPGGCIFIDIPHRDYRFKNDVYPHVYFFNPKSLIGLVNRAGYNVTCCEVIGHEASKAPWGDVSKSTWMKWLERIMYRFRKIMPIGLSKGFYQQYYGLELKHPEGTWLRLLASIK